MFYFDHTIWLFYLFANQYVVAGNQFFDFNPLVILNPSNPFLIFPGFLALMIELLRRLSTFLNS